MKHFLKDALLPIWSILRNKNLLTFYRLCSKYANVQRFVRFNDVKFDGFSVDVCDAPSFVYQYKDIFVDKIYSFKSQATPLIIDCGANIGLSVLFFKKIYPQSRIIAFEPDPCVFKILEKNIQNNAGVGVVELHNKAVWINSEPTGFLSDGADGGAISDSAEQKLPCIRLREVLERESTIDFLKLDIEGAEEIVLTDCQAHLGNVRNIFIEFHSKFVRKPKLSVVISILEKAGFSLYLSPVHTQSQPFLHTSANFQVNIFGFRDS